MFKWNKRKKVVLLLVLSLTLFWSGRDAFMQFYNDPSSKVNADTGMNLTSNKNALPIHNQFILEVTNEKSSDTDDNLIMQLPEGIQYVEDETIRMNDGLVQPESIVFNPEQAELVIQTNSTEKQTLKIVLQGEVVGDYQFKAIKVFAGNELSSPTVAVKITEATQTKEVPQEQESIAPRDTVGKAISSETDLIAALTSTTETEMHLTQSINLTKQAIVTTNNKVLDLNGFTITASVGSSVTTGGQIAIYDATGSTITAFTIKNGTINGGLRSTSETNAGFINAVGTTQSNSYNTNGSGYTRRANRPENLVFSIDNITYTGAEFFNGSNNNVEIQNNVNLTTEFFNIKARNVTAKNLSKYVGISTGSTVGDESVTRRYSQPVWMGYGQENGHVKKFQVDRGGSVELRNEGYRSSNIFTNALTGWTDIQIDGTFVANSYNPVLRTTANYFNSSAPRTSIKVNQGSIFKLTTTGTNTSNGVIYTYPFAMEIDDPQVFDLRFFGTGQFIYAYTRFSLYSDMSFTNTNVAVWDKSSRGIGNPLSMWQDLNYLKMSNFSNGSRGTITSDNAHAATNFNINNYSRISNDLLMPVLLPNLTLDGSTYLIGNNVVSVIGKTDYKNPDATLVGKGVAFGEVVLKVGTNTQTTQTDAAGNWTMTFPKYTTGATGTLRVTDSDQRYAEVPIKIIDTTPPIATGKLLKTELNSAAGIPTNPRATLTSFSDETTASAALKVEYVTTDAERADMIKTTGVKTINLAVTDAAGNKTPVQSTLLVNLTSTTNKGVIMGNNFRMSLSDWSADAATNRQIVIDKGNVAAWLIDSFPAEDVTADPARFTIDTSSVGAIGEVPYSIILEVAGERKVITVTFEDTTVPTATGILQNVKQFDSAALTNANVRSLLKDLNDNVSIPANIHAEYVAGQDFTALVATTGLKQVHVKITDEAKNSAIVTVPVMVSDGDMAAGDLVNIRAYSFTTIVENYPTTEVELRNMIITKARVQALSMPDGTDITNTPELVIDTSAVDVTAGKSSQITLTARDAQKVITITFKDNVKPTATGILQKIQQFDSESLTETPPKSLLKDLQDNSSTADKITAIYEPGQDFTNLVSTLGVKKVTIIIEDEAGNKSLIEIPIVVYDDSMLVGDQATIQGYDFRMSADDYPSTSSEIKQLVIASGRVQALSIPSGSDITNTDELVIDTSQVVVGSGKVSPIILTVRDTPPKTIYITFNDVDAPTGSGILQKIRLNDKTVLPAKDPKALIHDLADNATSTADIVVAYEPNQDFDALVASVGYKTIQVSATDKENNKSIFDVPVFVYDDSMNVTDNGAVQGNDIEIKLSDFPSTKNDLRAMIVTKGNLKAWLLPSGVMVDPNDIDAVEIDTSQILRAVGTYPVTLKVADAEKVIQFTVSQGTLNFDVPPTDIEFGNQEIKSKLAIYPPTTDVSMTLSDTRGTGTDWYLYLQVSKDLTSLVSPNKTIPGGMFFVNETNQEIDINSQNSLVRSGRGSLTPTKTDISWNRTVKQGVLLKVLPGQVNAGTYTGELVWTLADTPE
ncbi:hypothetical protein ACWOFR_05205 [Carnobacterium gallinarum]|uniref:hypothetical protein n=1 Tax=Carnobacterium gallinarum TaxID=2749 RepID=UPI00054EF760|nr:hypothetical protein [Carnobacterium gallinarum]